MPGQTIAVAFHNGDDFPEPDRPPKPENMLDAAVRIRSASRPFRNLRVDGKVLLADVPLASPGTALLSVRSRPNLIELDAAKFESYLKHEGLDHVVRWREEHRESAAVGRERYNKYVKSLVTVERGDGGFRTLAGFPIEIVPESDPTSLKPGDTLSLRVFFRGRPAADLRIEAAWLTPEGKAHRKIAGRTDREGKLDVAIGSRGTWKLHTVLMERCQEPSVADWESFWTSLTFEIP